MANKLLNKRSTVPGKNPAPESLDLGEIALNVNDGKLFFKKVDNSLAELKQVDIIDNITSSSSVYSSQKTQDLHDLQAASIANLATAQLQISGTTTTISTVPSILDFTVDFPSSDENMMTANATNNTFTFLKNASYNFSSVVNFLSSTNSAREITFNLIDTSDNSIITTESVTLDIGNGSSMSANLITLVTVGKNSVPNAPLTIRVEVSASGTGYSITSFRSILASSSSYDISANEASGIIITPVGSISSTNVQNALQELDSEKEPANVNIQNHILSTSNPHSVTKAQVGLGNVLNVEQLASTQTLTISGDITATSTVLSTGTLETTLAASGVTAATYGSSTNIPQIVIDAKGRITSASNVAVSIPSGSINVTGGDFTLSGNTGASITNATLAASGVTAGTYKSVTVDSKGRVTSGTNPTTLAGFGITDAASSTHTHTSFSSSISITGDITASGNITSTSDKRVKTNIEKIENALDKVLQLNGYTFDRTDIETPRQTGVIAQEVLEVLPEAVIGNENAYSVAYGNMIGLLIEAIKEQQIIINTLRGN